MRHGGKLAGGMMLAAAVLAGVPAAAPAAADSGTPYVLNVRVSDLHVTSGACVDIPVVVDFSFGAFGAPYEVDGIDTQFWHGSQYLDTETAVPTPLRGSEIHDTWQYCPHLYGLGTFTAGPSALSYHNTDTFENFTTTSPIASNFVVKQAAQAKVAATRSGRYVYARGRVRYFSVTDSAWELGTGRRVSLQKRVPGHPTWTIVARATLNARGVAAFPRQYARHAAYWRVGFAGSPYTWPSRSLQLLK